MRQYQGCTRACLSERYFGMAVVYFYVLEILCSKHWDLHADLLLCASQCTPMSFGESLSPHLPSPLTSRHSDCKVTIENSNWSPVVRLPLFLS